MTHPKSLSSAPLAYLRLIRPVNCLMMGIAVIVGEVAIAGGLPSLAQATFGFLVSFLLAGSAMVLFMTPGLGFFYGGLTRNKNVLATIMQSFIVTGVVAVIWLTVGYSLAFGPDQGLGLIGNLDAFGMDLTLSVGALLKILLVVSPVAILAAALLTLLAAFAKSYREARVTWAW